MLPQPLLTAFEAQAVPQDSFAQMLKAAGLYKDAEVFHNQEILDRAQKLTGIVEGLDRILGEIVSSQRDDFLQGYELFLKKLKNDLFELKSKYDIESTRLLSQKTFQSLERAFTSLKAEGMVSL